MSYHELLRTKEKLDRTDSSNLMSVVAIGLSRNLVYKILDQDKWKNNENIVWISSHIGNKAAKISFVMKTSVYIQRRNDQ